MLPVTVTSSERSPEVSPFTGTVHRAHAAEHARRAAVLLIRRFNFYARAFPSQPGEAEISKSCVLDEAVCGAGHQLFLTAQDRIGKEYTSICQVGTVNKV